MDKDSHYVHLLQTLGMWNVLADSTLTFPIQGNIGSATPQCRNDSSQFDVIRELSLKSALTSLVKKMICGDVLRCLDLYDTIFINPSFEQNMCLQCQIRFKHRLLMV